MSKICILGSGITGLSVAYYLKKYNPTAELIILEEQKSSGGVIESNVFGDCVVEWGPRGIRSKGNVQNRSIKEMFVHSCSKKHIKKLCQVPE